MNPPLPTDATPVAPRSDAVSSEGNPHAESTGVSHAQSPWPSAGKSASFLRRTVMFPLKFIWGMLFCQSFIGAMVVVGWSYRVAQRFILKAWWLKSERKTTFAQFVETIEPRHRHWPNWFCQQNFASELSAMGGSTLFTRAKQAISGLVSSLWTNGRIGLQGVLNTWLLTLPGCLLWWFGWYDGWNNSFNKGYEQAAAGPLISLLGIFVFIATMWYVPLAQARHAATMEWRSFYQFRIIWNIGRARWVSGLGLGVLYSCLSVPLMVMLIVPLFGPQNNPRVLQMSRMELLKYLNSYFFWCALFVFPAYVLLRIVGARVYASGVVALLQRGELELHQLGDSEQKVLQALNLVHTRPRPERHYFVRLLAWSGTRLGRGLSGTALTLIWFTFVAQIYITQFFCYRGMIGWINQPLVQLPWFHYLPKSIKPVGEEIFGGLFLILLLALAAWSVRRVKRLLPAASGSGVK
jgi:hypothetical protein